jgi:TonB family protein
LEVQRDLAARLPGGCLQRTNFRDMIIRQALRVAWQPHSGIVSVKVLIKADGTVSDDMEILNAPPEMNLEKNIRDTVSKWRFKPAEKDGVPVAIKGTIQVTFRWR